MKILITGTTGYIGHNLYSHLARQYEVYGIGHDSNKKLSTDINFEQLDITDSQLVSQAILKLRPDVIIHTAAVSSLKLCKDNYDQTYNVNVTGVQNVADAILELNKQYKKECKLIFLSTDYVFDGNKGDYTEDDVPNPNTEYGKQKLLAEQLIQKYLNNYLIIRLSNVYLKGGKFFEFVEKNLNDEHPTDYFNDTFYTPIDIYSLTSAIEALINSSTKGTLNIAGPDQISRYNFSVLLAQMLKKDHQKLIIPATSSEDVLIGKNQTLNIEKLKKLFPKISLSSVRHALYLEHGFFIKPYFAFKDDRGLIAGIIQGTSFEEINYIESKANVVRGNHYHNETDEIIHVINGKMEVTLYLPEGPILKNYTIQQGDTVYLMPGIAHKFETKTNAKWINMLSKAMNTEKKDIVPATIKN